jgi:DNA-binding PadR family transcriptional regulator
MGVAEAVDSRLMSEPSKPLGDAVAEATEAAGGSESTTRRKRTGKPQDVFGAEMRRRDLLPLLVFHLIRGEPSYGNQLIDAIETLTQGVVSVNPNTMYPLLRDLESKGLIEGSWEHPDKRTRRFYSITPSGEVAYQELRPEIEPFLDSVIRSVTMIKAEVFGS